MRDGFTGTMYYIQVDSMRKYETEMLAACKKCRERVDCDSCCQFNKQMKSNVSVDRDGPGYVYGIEGSKDEDEQ